MTAEATPAGDRSTAVLRSLRLRYLPSKPGSPRRVSSETDPLGVSARSFGRRVEVELPHYLAVADQG